MSDKYAPSLLKDGRLFGIKKKLNLALNILISFLGISSLFIKFFLVDGLLAFRAFTVDGNLFTTLVTVIVTIVNIDELRKGCEHGRRKLFFLQLASAVTEAVIFIVVMIGYLPFFADDPQITPYHMFCLHVAIPVLAVLRFIFFEKPIGILSPRKLLSGAIPIGVYGIGVVTAIKLGILPVSLVPYSFLDFESNFLWYFIFALIVIPSFGYLWSWLFYRLNIKTSLLWYDKKELEKLDKERLRSLSSFDSANSSIMLVYCLMALVVLLFSLLGTSNTTTKIQHELTADLGYYIIDDYDHMLGDGTWHIQDGDLYKGDMFVGDGKTEEVTDIFLADGTEMFDLTVYVQAKDLSSEIAEEYNPYDFVSVRHSSGEIGPIQQCGEVLDKNVVAAIFESDSNEYYEEVKVGKEKYFHYCLAFGETMLDNGVGIISAYLPSSELTAQAKNVEYNHDVMMIGVVVLVFAILFIISLSWIKILEKSINFLKAIASGRIPEEPISLGKHKRLSGLERELNILREINKE